MKDKFLKMAGVKSEQEFYKKYPTEDAFFQAYPQAVEMKSGGNVPTNPGLYSRVKSEAKSKFSTWPSAYGSAWLVKTYKSRGGGYRKAQYGAEMDMFQYPNYDGNINAYYQDMREDDANNPTSAIGNFLYNGAMAAGKSMDNAIANGEDTGNKMQMAKLAMNAMGMPAMGMGGVGMMMGDNYYDEGGEMAMGQIMAMNDKIARLQNFINAESEVEPWVASKLTLADDYLTSAADYLQYNEGSEEGEEEEEMNLTMGELNEMKNGGIPERYRSRGFTQVGAKRQSNRPGKKWMVLAKKGDKYKIVHGGYKGMKDFSQHGSNKRKDNFWNRMGGKNSAKATDPFSPLYWHKRFGTWAKGGEMMPPEIARARFAAAGNLDKLDDYGYARGGEPTNAGFQALPEYVQNKIMSNMAYGGMTYPFMQDGGPALTEEQKAAAEVAAKKKKRNDTMTSVGLGVGTAAGIIASEIRDARKQRGYDEFMNSNDPRIGTGQYPSNRELRKMGRRMYGGDTDMYGGQMDMDAMYNMAKGGQPCYECGGKVYQEGGQQDQVMQAIQMYAQMTQVNPEDIIKQLKAMSPEKQQQAIQQIMQAIQQAQASQPSEMAYGGININSANFARNAASFKKQMGGMAEGAEIELDEDEIQSLIDQGYGIEYLD